MLLDNMNGNGAEMSAEAAGIAICLIEYNHHACRTECDAMTEHYYRLRDYALRRLVQRINEIMIHAVNVGLIDANPASGIGNAFERPKKQHMPTIRPEELPKLMRTISMSNLSIPTRCLLEWQLLTLIRPAEASATAWADVARVLSHFEPF